MTAKQQLIQDLINDGYLKTPGLIKAFKKIDRQDFVLPEYKKSAYENQALPILSGQTISQPATVAFMLELLEPASGQKILEVGSGCGWQTAMLAQIIGPGGKIFALEIIQSLIDFAQANLKKYDFSNIIMKYGDGWRGLPEAAPFDRIIVAAAASEIPRALKEQLTIGGHLVLPVGEIEQSIVLLERKSHDEFVKTEFPGFIFVPLVKA